jgi:hypothetical protein
MRKAPLVGFGLLVFVAACVNATTDVKGGEGLFDTTPPPSSVTPQTCDIGADAGSGTHWSDLYRDFFGPTGAASCAGNGTCHGDANQSGAKSSGGYVCGANKDDCRASLLSENTGLIALPADQAAPEKSGLVTELRRKKADGTVVGLMPKTPACVFEPEAIDRITTWIKNGAPND